MNKKVWLGAAFVVTLMGVAMGACNSKKETNSSCTTTSEAKGTVAAVTCTANDLSGKWTLVSIDGKEVKTEREAFMEFDTATKRIHGSAGCNIINSVYEIDESKNMAITFKPAQMTMMACIDMEAENAFVRIYPEIASFTFAKTADGKCCAEGKSTLLFLDKDGKELMRLKKQE